MKNDKEFKTLHIFSGLGGGILADLILGHDPIVAVEIEPYRCEVLRQRAAEGWFPNLRVIQGDIRDIHLAGYSGQVDCIHAGFPCQDISTAGKGAGIEGGSRSGLWSEVIRTIRTVRPQYAFLENVPAITGRGLDRVLSDLAEAGFNAAWTCLQAAECGANHQRDRWWCLAYAHGTRQLQPQGREQEQRGWAGNRFSEAGNVTDIMQTRWNAGAGCSNAGGEAQKRSSQTSNTERLPEGTGDVTDIMRERHKRQGRPINAEHSTANSEGQTGNAQHDSGWWTTEPDVVRMVPRVPNRSHRIAGLGDSQVPLQAAAAFSTLWQMIHGEGAAA